MVQKTTGAKDFRATADLFSKYFYGVFNTTAQAEVYAQQADPRLWALVIFDKGPNAGGSGKHPQV